MKYIIHWPIIHTIHAYNSAAKVIMVLDPSPGCEKISPVRHVLPNRKKSARDLVMLFVGLSKLKKIWFVPSYSKYSPTSSFLLHVPKLNLNCANRDDVSYLVPMRFFSYQHKKPAKFVVQQDGHCFDGRKLRGMNDIKQNIKSFIRDMVKILSLGAKVNCSISLASKLLVRWNGTILNSLNRTGFNRHPVKTGQNRVLNWTVLTSQKWSKSGQNPKSNTYY